MVWGLAIPEDARGNKEQDLLSEMTLKRGPDNFLKCYSVFCTKEVWVWGWVCMQVTKLFSFDEITLHGEPGPTHEHLLTTGKPGPLPFFVGHFVAKGHAAREEVSSMFPVELSRNQRETETGQDSISKPRRSSHLNCRMEKGSFSSEIDLGKNCQEHYFKQ